MGRTHRLLDLGFVVFFRVSTSVLIVAGIVGGLIVVALIVAIVICCVKTYRDKRASRVRQLRPGHRGHDEGEASFHAHGHMHETIFSNFLLTPHHTILRKEI